MIIHVFATYSNIYGHSISFDDFKIILSKFNRNYLLGILIKLDCTFYKYSYFDAECQDYFIKSFFPIDKQEFIFSKLIKMGEGRNVLIFSKQQVHNLIK